VESTLTHVYRKLGVSSRSQLARLYAERDGGG
jgi:DNA-binding CsgD family transcriptional regulator